MATYDSLTQPEKDLIAVWERNFRGWINGIISKGIVQGRALDAAYDASDGPGTILATLDAGEVIPNSSGIAGAQDLDTAELATLVAGFNAFLTTYDTLAVRQNAAKAAGPLRTDQFLEYPCR